MNTVSDIVKAFGGATAFASAISAKRATVYQWVSRGSIPPAYFADIIAAAPEHDVQVTWLQLHAMHKREAAQ